MEAGNLNGGLVERLESWRSEISGGDLSPDDVDELQSHLEDSIDEFKSKGISEDDAWLLATHRMGSAESIKKEFKKVKDSRVPILNHILYWGMLIVLLNQLIGIGGAAFIYAFSLGLGSIPPFTLVFSVIVLAMVCWIIYKRKEIKGKTRIGVFGTAISLSFISLFFGFLIYFEGPACRNENTIFAKNAPGSEVYNKELIRLFTMVGTDNLYFRFNKYVSENGQDYVILNAIGRDFCAEFPLNITHAKRVENVVRVKGISYEGSNWRGLKFDLVAGKSGTEFIFKDVERIVD